MPTMNRTLIRGVLTTIAATAAISATAACEPVASEPSPAGGSSTASQAAPASENVATSGPEPGNGSSDSQTAEPGQGTRECSVSDVEPDPVAERKWDQTGWEGSIVVANVGKDTCTVAGTGKVFAVLPDEKWLELKQTPYDDAPSGEVVELAPSDRAVLRLRIAFPPEAEDSENCPKPNMLGVALPGETKSLEVAPPENRGELPPVCGNTIAVSDWSAE